MWTGTSVDTENVGTTAQLERTDRHKFVTLVVTEAIARVSTTYTPIIAPDGTINGYEPMLAYPPGATPTEEVSEYDNAETIYARYENKMFQHGFALAANLLKININIPRLEPGIPYNDGVNAAIDARIKSIYETNNAFEEGYKVGEVVLEHTGLQGLIDAMAKINSTILKLPVNIGFKHGFQTFYLSILEGFYEVEDDTIESQNETASNEKKEGYPEPKAIRPINVTINYFGASSISINSTTLEGTIVYDEIQNLYLIRLNFGDENTELIHYISIKESVVLDENLTNIVFNIPK